MGAGGLIAGGMANTIRLDPKVDYEKKYYESGRAGLLEGTTMSMTLGNSVNAVAIPGYLLIDLHADVDYKVNESEALGSGGTASIYMGKLKSPALIEKYGKVQVAVKILKEKVKDQSPAQHEEVNKNFLYEVALMSSLPPSPYIVQLIGFSEDPKGIVMKYYPLSLKSLLRDPDFDCSPMVNAH
jgi:hypothetical protein